MFRKILAVVSLSFLCLVAHAQGTPKPLEEGIPNRFAQELKVQHLHAKWRARVQSLLDAGKLPKIDMETSWSEDAVRGYIPEIFSLLDELGVALIAADGRQRKADGSAGYRWSNYMLEAAEMYPDRFIPTTNGGTSPNWLDQKDGTGSFIEQLEKQIRAGHYALIGELDFRH